MEIYNYHFYVFFIVVIVIIFLIYLFFTFLREKDRKIDYTNKKIKYYIQNIDGTDYIFIPYFFWQEGKLNAIKTMFSDSFEYEGQLFRVEFLYSDQDHLARINDILPKVFYRDCKSVIKHIESKSSNYGNINNTYISGDNNQVSIQQNQYFNIETEIQKFIKNENNLSDFDKEVLQSFLYQLSKGSPEENTAKKVVDILNKFLPLTTAIINMIKALTF